MNLRHSREVARCSFEKNVEKTQKATQAIIASQVVHRETFTLHVAAKKAGALMTAPMRFSDRQEENDKLARRVRESFRTLIALTGVVLGFGAAASALVPPDYTKLPTEVISPALAPASLSAQQNMIEIPAGDYAIGRNDGPRSERPVHVVALKAFRIDQTEVTNEAFAEFLNALGLELAGSAMSGRTRGVAQTLPETARGLFLESGDNYPLVALDDDEARIDIEEGRFVPRRGYAQHPVAETTWAGAMAYCHWRGGYLPSEVQWEVAARGTDGRLYPWGNEAPDDSRAYRSYRTAETATVGSLDAGKSAFGLDDMSGSMAEWTSTLKRPYPYSSTDGREDPALPGERVTRGGDYVFDTAPANMTATHRDGFSNAPENGHRHIGFRCAASE